MSDFELADWLEAGMRAFVESRTGTREEIDRREAIRAEVTSTLKFLVEQFAAKVIEAVSRGVPARSLAGEDVLKRRGEREVRLCVGLNTRDELCAIDVDLVDSGRGYCVVGRARIGPAAGGAPRVERVEVFGFDGGGLEWSSGMEPWLSLQTFAGSTVRERVSLAEPEYGLE